MSGAAESVPVTVIQGGHQRRWVDWREFWEYRDLLYFLVWRDIKARYAQSVLGIGWAVIQPVFTMVVFTVVFGNLAEISSDGVPYSIFSLAALVPWTYFSTALTSSSTSLTTASGMITKVYFPRLVIPLTPVLGKLVDFCIGIVIVSCFMLWYGITPTPWVILLPFLVIVMMITAAGMGMWVTALAVQYRDVQYAMSFLIQLLMYAAPVVYPASLIPAQYRAIYAINPMAGVIEGFRSVLLSTNPVPWDLIIIGALSAVTIVTSGLLFFQRMEKNFADVA
ncbi:MAG: ABC transporter permease [Rhodothermales bacterium]